MSTLDHAQGSSSPPLPPPSFQDPTQPLGGDTDDPPTHMPANGFHAFQPLFNEPPSALSRDLKPRTSATLTVRIIKSFEYRTFKAMVLQDINLEEMTVGELKELVRERLKTAPGFKAYRSLELDTLKTYTVAHGSKTTNLIINLEHDDWILDDHSKTLSDIGAENETELSFFNRAAYESFKSNPEIKWE